MHLRLPNNMTCFLSAFHTLASLTLLSSALCVTAAPLPLPALADTVQVDLILIKRLGSTPPVDMRVSTLPPAPFRPFIALVAPYYIYRSVEGDRIATQSSTAVRLLPTEKQAIRDTQRRLQSSAHFHVIKHLAWQAHCPPGAPALHFFIPPQDYDEGSFKGWMTLSRHHYYDIDLDIRAQVQADGSESVPVRLHQSRRLRSQQLNALDHPYLEALVWITLIKPDADSQ